MSTSTSDYDTFAEEWNKTRKNPWGEFEFAREMLNAKNILDAGCGNGRLVKWLREQGFQGEYLGIDSSQELIQLAKKNFPEEQFKVCDLLTLTPQTSGGLTDAIFCVAVLHHMRSVDERLQAVKNLYFNLADGGKLFLTTWNLFQPRYWKHLLKCRSRDCEIDFAGKGTRFVHAFTKRELKKLLQQAGFKKIKIFYARHAEKSTFLRGRNLIALAQK